MNSEPEEDMDDRQLRTEGRQNFSYEMLERLSMHVSERWLGGYEGLGIVPGILGTAMLGASVVEMVLSTVVRMSILYAWKGPGPWMAAALWSTTFQVVTMPCRWALEWGQNQGEAIAQAMEDKIGGANLPLDGGGTSTTDSERN